MVDMFQIGCVWNVCVTKMWRCVTPRLVRGRDAMGDDDVLTPFIEQYYDVFMTHVLPRVNAPVMMCACGVEDAIPASFFGNLVLPQLSKTFYQSIPGYREAREAHGSGFQHWTPRSNMPERDLRAMFLLNSSPSVRDWLYEFATGYTNFSSRTVQAIDNGIRLADQIVCSNRLSQHCRGKVCMACVQLCEACFDQSTFECTACCFSGESKLYECFRCDALFCRACSTSEESAHRMSTCIICDVFYCNRCSETELTKCALCSNQACRFCDGFPMECDGPCKREICTDCHFIWNCCDPCGTLLCDSCAHGRMSKCSECLRTVACNSCASFQMEYCDSCPRKFCADCARGEMIVCSSPNCDKPNYCFFCSSGYYLCNICEEPLCEPCARKELISCHECDKTLCMLHRDGEEIYQCKNCPYKCHASCATLVHEDPYNCRSTAHCPTCFTRLKTWSICHLCSEKICDDQMNFRCSCSHMVCDTCADNENVACEECDKEVCGYCADEHYHNCEHCEERTFCDMCSDKWMKKCTRCSKELCTNCRIGAAIVCDYCYDFTCLECGPRLDMCAVCRTVMCQKCAADPKIKCDIMRCTLCHKKQCCNQCATKTGESRTFICPCCTAQNASRSSATRAL